MAQPPMNAPGLLTASSGVKLLIPCIFCCTFFHPAHHLSVAACCGLCCFISQIARSPGPNTSPTLSKYGWEAYIAVHAPVRTARTETCPALAHHESEVLVMYCAKAFNIKAHSGTANHPVPCRVDPSEIGSCHRTKQHHLPS